MLAAKAKVGRCLAIATAYRAWISVTAGAVQTKEKVQWFPTFSVIHYTYTPTTGFLTRFIGPLCTADGHVDHAIGHLNSASSTDRALMSAFSKMRRLVGLEGRSVGESEGDGESAVREETSPFGDGGPDDHTSESGFPESTVFDTDTCDDNLAIIDSDSHLIDACAAIIEGATPSSSSSKAPFTRGHRRRSTHVTRRDLEKFQKEVLGVENHASWFDEDSGTSRINPYDPQLEELNRAFALADMSMNSGAGMPSNGPGSAAFSGFDNSSPNPNVPRQSMSPALPHPSAQANGGGMGPAMNANMSMNAGHQMDLHHLYEMVLELSEVLKNNREVTKSIVSSAEEIMKHGSSEGASPAMQQINGEISGEHPSLLLPSRLPFSVGLLTVLPTAVRISELERALAKERRVVEDLKREQLENTKLIGEWEASVGTMVEQIRNYCQNNNLHYLYQKSHYNNLLQAERDAHLESRLDRDYWHAQTMKCAEMIRTAHRLRSEEDELPVRIIVGLQNEIRAYRNALGMEPEKPEEEYGWEILKDVSPAE